jgi:Mlc titration factor MtfA (ptsG expression regulator)
VLLEQRHDPSRLQLNLVFQRVTTLGANVLGDNNNSGRIRLADLAFTSSSTSVQEVVIHEIGHNWDNENPAWSNFQALSGWRSWAVGRAVPAGFTRARNLQGVAQPWIYRTGTSFSRLDGYGRTNPYEDFATCLETYYSGKNPASNWQTKWNFINNWLNTMSNS